MVSCVPALLLKDTSLVACANTAPNNRRLGPRSACKSFNYVDLVCDKSRKNSKMKENLEICGVSKRKQALTWLQIMFCAQRKIVLYIRPSDFGEPQVIKPISQTMQNS
jgi:hypothetical protein